jgi:hypothetical protein
MSALYRPPRPAMGIALHFFISGTKECGLDTAGSLWEGSEAFGGLGIPERLSARQHRHAWF